MSTDSPFRARCISRAGLSRAGQHVVTPRGKHLVSDAEHPHIIKCLADAELRRAVENIAWSPGTHPERVRALQEALLSYGVQMAKCGGAFPWIPNIRLRSSSHGHSNQVKVAVKLPFPKLLL